MQASRTHRQMLEVIPWYLNGSLDPDEHRDVERHLEVCELCRGELAAALRISEVEVDGASARLAAHPARLDAMMSKIDRQEARSLRRFGRLLGGWWNRDRAPGEHRLGPMWLLVAAQTVLVVVVSAVLWLDHRADVASRESAYRTLSSLPQSQAGPALRIVFRDDVAAGEIEMLVESMGGSLTEGPSPLGVYTIELPVAAPSAVATAREDLLEELRRDPRVRFVTLVGEVAGEVAGEVSR